MAVENKLIVSAWGLSAITVILSFLAWGQGLRWQLNDLSAYDLFPLFGLLAFSLMWTHYVMAALRRYMGFSREVLKKYFEITTLVVLAALLLHPGLLILQLWLDGFGLPPGSYKAYVGDSLAWVVMLGTVSLFAFLAFEFRRIFEDRPWWRFVQYASDAAIIAIYYHGLRLGNELQNTWLQFVWYFYGVTLLLALVYSYSLRFKRKQLE